MIIQAFKSKTVWLGILSSAWGLVQGFMAAGDFSREAVTALGTGILIIALRAVTTKPLSQK